MNGKNMALWAQHSAEELRKYFGMKPGRKVDTGLILGTGWGDSLHLNQSQEIPFVKIAGFESLNDLHGHSRKLEYGIIPGGGDVLVLRGRVHLNEAPPSDEKVFNMVRLEVEILMQLGVRKLIVTSAVGSLHENLRVGDIVIPDGFVTLFAPAMPMFTGEFYSPEDTLDEDLRALGLRVAEDQQIRACAGGHVMVRGPFFEGRKYDKAFLASTGAIAVGMSMLPEACVASIYNAKVLGFGLVTNSAFEKHEHETNVERAKAQSCKLGMLLSETARRLQSLSEN
jgi:purine nucleoside phosphorylase